MSEDDPTQAGAFPAVLQHAKPFPVLRQEGDRYALHPTLLGSLSNYKHNMKMSCQRPNDFGNLQSICKPVRSRHGGISGSQRTTRNPILSQQQGSWEEWG